MGYIQSTICRHDSSGIEILHKQNNAFDSLPTGTDMDSCVLKLPEISYVENIEVEGTSRYKKKKWRDC